jgi:hypothetical protein
MCRHARQQRPEVRAAHVEGVFAARHHDLAGGDARALGQRRERLYGGQGSEATLPTSNHPPSLR